VSYFATLSLLEGNVYYMDTSIIWKKKYQGNDEND